MKTLFRVILLCFALIFTVQFNITQETDTDLLFPSRYFPDDLEPITRDNIDRLQEVTNLTRGRVNGVRWLGDSSYFIVHSDNGVWVFDVNRPDVIPFESPVEKPIGIHPNGDILTEEDQQLYLADVWTGEQREYFKLETRLRNLDFSIFSSDATRLIIGDVFQDAFGNGSLYAEVWNLTDTPTFMRTITSETIGNDPTLLLRFSRTNDYVISACDYGYNYEETQLVWQLSSDTAPIMVPCRTQITSSDDTIVWGRSYSLSSPVTIMDVPSNSIRFVITSESVGAKSINTMLLSPDGKLLFVWFKNRNYLHPNRLVIYDRYTGAEIMRSRWVERAPNVYCFDGVGFPDMSIRCSDLNPDQLIDINSIWENDNHSMQNTYLVSLPYSTHPTRRWRILRDEITSPYHRYGTNLGIQDLSMDDFTVVLRNNSFVNFGPSENERLLNNIEMTTDLEWAVASTYCNDHCSLDRFRLIDTTTSHSTMQILVAYNDLSPLVISPDSQYVASSSASRGYSQLGRGNGTVSLTSLDSGTKVRSWDFPQSNLEFSPNGRYLLGHNEEYRIFAIWDMARGEEVYREKECSCVLAFINNHELLIARIDADSAQVMLETYNLKRNLLSPYGVIDKSEAIRTLDIMVDSGLIVVNANLMGRTSMRYDLDTLQFLDYPTFTFQNDPETDELLVINRQTNEIVDRFAPETEVAHSIYDRAVFIIAEPDSTHWFTSNSWSHIATINAPILFNDRTSGDYAWLDNQSIFVFLTGYGIVFWDMIEQEELVTVAGYNFDISNLQSPDDRIVLLYGGINQMIHVLGVFSE